MDELRAKLFNIILVAKMQLRVRLNIAAIYYIINQLIQNGVAIPVRCKDCKYCYKVHLLTEHDICGKHDMAVNLDDFCSYGERRTVNDGKV